MFAGNATAYPSEAPFRCSNLGYAPELTQKHQTSLERTNTLVFCEHLQITDIKSIKALDVLDLFP